MSTDAQALVEATRLFLARHEEALSSGEPTRGIAACEGIIEALGATLPDEIERADPEGGEAREVVLRRVAELEGLAMQLKLAFHQLEERQVDVLRLVALLTASRRQIHALRSTLELWAATHGAPAPVEPAPFEALRAARECLSAGCAQAAREALRHALRRAGKTSPVGEGDDLVSAWKALDDAERVMRAIP